MLAPEIRVVLLEQLRPPVGYTMDAAVATTFTLDLSAALIPPLAFAAFSMSSTPDPVAALEAVRSCADRLDIFAQGGELIVPRQPSDLMAFLEPMVHEVRLPRRGRLFHPKVWLLRYRSPDDAPRYRMLCLTRNLTNDHSWDLALRLDGTDTGKRRPANRPLVRFVQALPDFARTPLPPDRRDRVAQLAADVYRVRWELPDDAWDLRFHALGIRGVKPDIRFDGYCHLVIAPFLTDGGLKIVAPGRSNPRGLPSGGARPACSGHGLGALLIRPQRRCRPHGRPRSRWAGHRADPVRSPRQVLYFRTSQGGSCLSGFCQCDRDGVSWQRGVPCGVHRQHDQAWRGSVPRS